MDESPDGFHRTLIPALLASFLVGVAGRAEAFQVHPAAEGLYAHQLGHLFFTASMGILIYWLRTHRLVTEKGWRFIQYSALFFILWNVEAVAVHYLDGRHDLFQTINAGSWHGEITPVQGLKFPTVLYYIGKMDHLVCVPAILFLYLGLRDLLHKARTARVEEVPK